MKREQLIQQLDELLKPHLFRDYAPNGLQVAGRDDIKKIVTGVTACQALLDRAVELGADAVLVHHGYFWKGEDPCVVGMKQRRLSTLLQHGINLLAYHLPLDAHDELGNNKQLANVLNIVPEGQFSSGETPALTWYGRLAASMTAQAFSRHIAEKLDRQPLLIQPSSHQADTTVQTIAWCTGAAQDFTEPAAMRGFDAFLTGEVSERTYHIAEESGICFYGAGHHATERYGIKALGEYLQQKYGIECVFADIDNPV